MKPKYPIHEALLKSMRARRHFNVDEYIQRKLVAINSFFATNDLDAAVLGVSGGIDSAVVLALLKAASKESDSPIANILPISMPISRSEGVTGQPEAANKAKTVITSLGFDYYEVELSQATASVVKGSCKPLSDRQWAEGQLCSVMRTPVLYYHASILQTAGHRSIVVGTTNRDEGAYIGFFGKASDGMVDLQPIADIHKSEVYLVARKLKLPMVIIEATPKGDVFDGRVDEQMIGAPYWFLELYQLLKYYDVQPFEMLEKDPKEMEAYINWATNIQSLHFKNKHKYQVGSPAHYIDVMDRIVPISNSLI